MLIEELIRLGRPLIAGGLDAAELVGLITDVGDERVRNFYRHVFVVELPMNERSTNPILLPMQVWGNDIDDDFRVDTTRAAGAPISLPSGGNPLHPQGRYGVPVYPCWDAHFQAFRQSVQGVVDFLRGRVERTLGLSLPEETIRAIAEQLHSAVVASPSNPREKWLGIVILAWPHENGCYCYAAHQSRSVVGASAFFPGQFLVPNLDQHLRKSGRHGLPKGPSRAAGQGAARSRERGKRSLRPTALSGRGRF